MLSKNKVMLYYSLTLILIYLAHPWDLDGDGAWNILKEPADCNDLEPLIHPFRNESMYNRIDDDCNPLTYDDYAEEGGVVTRQDPSDNATGGPNLLLITIDALRPDHMGTYGYGRDTTPNIDALAAESTIFTNAYTHVPWTQPSVASILTGMHPLDLAIPDWGYRLSEKHTTLTEMLDYRGYHTEAFLGHMAFQPKYGFSQGFDHYDYSVLKQGHPDHITTSANLTDKVLARIPVMRQPFFIWIHYFDPHYIYKPHEGFNYGDTFLDLYDGEIAYTDQHVGRLINGLREAGVYDTTIIVLTADHGEQLGEHNVTGHSTVLYQESARIPLMIKAPGVGHRIVDTVIAESDITPTLLYLMNMPQPEGMHGRVIGPAGDRTVFLMTRQQADMDGVIHEGYKLVTDHDTNSTELYDILEDPSEQHNLAGKMPGKTAELRQMLIEFYPADTPEPEPVELGPDTVKKLRDMGYAA
ncbi:MAG: sulfatase-like hydrolase/transferase [Candidatus Altiarchaeota archaeon]